MFLAQHVEGGEETRRLAPLEYAKAADLREKNSRSIAVSTFKRRSRFTAPSTLQRNLPTFWTETGMTFSRGMMSRASRMKRLSSNTRKCTLSRPTISTARRRAGYARTVEPCSASLMKRRFRGGDAHPGDRQRNTGFTLLNAWHRGQGHRLASGIGNWDQPRHTTCSSRPLPKTPTYRAFWSVFGVQCPDCNGWPRRWVPGGGRVWRG